MKKILKLGKRPEPVSKIRRFRCSICECIFEADEVDYRKDTNTHGSVLEYFSDCPECGSISTEVITRNHL